MSKHAVFLVTCTKAKGQRSRIKPVPAKELYLPSNLFAAARRLVETTIACLKNEGIDGEWFIISAKHHLLPPDQPVSYYDKTLLNKSPAYRRKWSEIVASQLQQWLQRVGWNIEDTEVIILAGPTYSEFLIPLLCNLGLTVFDPFFTISGEGRWSTYHKRVAWMKRMLQAVQAGQCRWWQEVKYEACQ